MGAKRPRRHYHDWITAYTETVTPRSEAPERFHFWTAASILGGALRRRVWIDQEIFRWYPNFFIVLVGPPGIIKKSTTINAGMSLLRKVPNINFGSDVTTWEGYIQEVEEAVDEFAMGGARGATLSVEDEYEHCCAITHAISEWGTFLDPKNYNMINVLTELYDCKSGIPLRKNTKTQGVNEILNPFVNMIAATTPDWMNANFRGNFGGWGFSSRCIFLYCDRPERTIAYPASMWRGQFADTMNNFLADLIEISHLSGQFTFTPPALDYGREWYAQHQSRMVALNAHPEHDPWLSYFLARKFDHIHKLAMVLSVSRSNELVIDAPDLVNATRRCDEVEIELTKIFGRRPTEATRAARLNQDVFDGLKNMIEKNNGGIPEHAAFAFTQRYMNFGDARQFINHCLAAHHLVRIVDTNGTWYVLGERSEPQPYGAEGAMGAMGSD